MYIYIYIYIYRHIPHKHTTLSRQGSGLNSDEFTRKTHLVRQSQVAVGDESPGNVGDVHMKIVITNRLFKVFPSLERQAASRHT